MTLPPQQQQQQQLLPGTADPAVLQEFSEIRPATPLSATPAVNSDGLPSGSQHINPNKVGSGGKDGGGDRQRKRSWLGFLFSPRRPAQPAPKKRVPNALLQ
uniref:Uncharacterized protein n=1 Tax=Dunaliella tertiolecta TaxID=3047 RepID=A0A7S3VPP6_DUNTE